MTIAQYMFTSTLVVVVLAFTLLPKQPSTPPPSIQEATLHLMCADSRKLDSVRNKLYTCSVHRNKHD